MPPFLGVVVDFSERQAKRYIQLAKGEREPVPIPDVKIAFTIMGLRQNV